MTTRQDGQLTLTQACKCLCSSSHLGRARTASLGGSRLDALYCYKKTGMFMLYKISYGLELCV